MTVSVAEHYDHHLGPVYDWMVGDFEEASNRAMDYFEDIRISPADSQIAIDLGCGHGIQSIPLAQRGFQMVAIDSCEHLLDQLRQRQGELDIQTVNDDLRMFDKHVDSEVDVIVCMGDTLTHLSTMDDVRQLLSLVSTSLRHEGVFCTSFRDYSSGQLEGVSRFIPVRADDSRIHTCFLEYGPKSVSVHDLIFTKNGEKWTFAASAYNKIRLDPTWLIKSAEQEGLKLFDESTIHGMGYYAFRKESDSGSGPRLSQSE